MQIIVDILTFTNAKVGMSICHGTLYIDFAVVCHFELCTGVNGCADKA